MHTSSLLFAMPRECGTLTPVHKSLIWDNVAICNR